MVASKSKCGHQRLQHAGAILERRCRSRQLFPERRVALSRLIKLSDGLLDRDQDLPLANCRGGYLVDPANNVVRRFHETRYRRSSLGNTIGASIDAAARLGAKCTNLSSRLGCTLSQLPHFRGNDPKASSPIACARRLYRSIERKHVGLKGNGVDEFNNLGDLARGICDVLHLCAQPGDRLVALMGSVASTTGHVAGLTRRLQTCRDGLGQVPHGAVGFL